MTYSSASWSRVVRHINEGTDTDQRYTPCWVLDLVENILGCIDLDPCADPKCRVPAKHHFTKEDDGLDKGWSGKVFVNPPFSNSSDWVKHLCIYFHSGAVTEALVLLPVMAVSNKSSKLLMKGTATAFSILTRKLSFLNGEYEEMGDMTSFPFALIYSGPRTNRFLKMTEMHGIGCVLSHPGENQQSRLCKYCGKSFSAKRSTAKYCGTTCRVQSHRKHSLAGVSTTHLPT